MIAFQFPPFGQSTGRLRTLGFARHLPAHGWNPIVLTGRESAYPEIDLSTLADSPRDVEVVRAFGIDIGKSFAIRGIYPRFLAIPDRWNTWAIGAALQGVRLVRAGRARVVWATFPIPSAVLAALTIHKITGVPLVADLRDPMVYDSWPRNRFDRMVYGAIERAVVRAAAAVVLTTESACQHYRKRYPAIAPQRFQVIQNGVDAEGSDSALLGGSRPGDGSITLLHSGLMELPDRDPTALFMALRLLKDRGRLPTAPLRVRLRASGSERAFDDLAREFDVSSMVEMLPRISHRDAIQEMLQASALVLFQGRVCDSQIPAKAYEYLLSGLPIIGLLSPTGDTHRLVADEWRVPYCADMSNAEQIASVLEKFFDDLSGGGVFVPPALLHARYLRKRHAEQLAALLDGVCDASPARDVPA